MSTPASFGRLAWIYRWMEYLSFGPYLKHCRELRIAEMLGRQRILVYGDGDGRFLATLVQRAQALQITAPQITAVDASHAMLDRVAQKLPRGAQARLVHADALIFEPNPYPEGPFDLVVSHFFLDCFAEDELAQLMRHVNTAVEPDAMWVVSDFAIPRHRGVRLFGWLVVRGLYLAFGILTGLRTRRLPDHERVMQTAGWMREDRQELLCGLLISERWRRRQ